MNPILVFLLTLSAVLGAVWVVFGLGAPILPAAVLIAAWVGKAAGWFPSRNEPGR